MSAGFLSWQRTRVWCADLDAAGMGGCFDEPTRGYAYDGGFIVDNGDGAGIGRRYWLIICNEEWVSDELDTLERILFREWVLPHAREGYTVGTYEAGQ